MNAKNLFMAVFAPLLLTGCNNVDDTLEVNKPKDPAVEMVENFYASSYSKSRTAGAKIDVSEISVARYRIESDSNVTTLPENAGSRSLDPNVFEIKTVKFNVNNESGYAILSDDIRLRNVYFFTAQGSINDTAKIEPLKDFIAIIPELAKDGILDWDADLDIPVTGEPFEPIPFDSLPPAQPGPEINGDSIVEEIAPIVTVRWGQGYPYNMYGKECSCDSCSKDHYRYHNPMGCVTVAGATLIAKCGKFKGTFYGNGNIDFDKLLLFTTAYWADEATKSAFGHFFHEIALGCQTQFNCKRSHSKIKALWQYLKREQGYDCDYISGSLNVDRFKKDLKNGYPHAMAGRESGASAGHAWIVSGYQKRKNGKEKYYCNWGWDGDSDGWADAPYASDDYYLSTDNKHIFINSVN